MTSLHAITIPVFHRQLKNLQGILKIAQTWCKDNGKPDSYVLEARIAPDMEPLPFQIMVATQMAKSGIFTGPEPWKWQAPVLEMKKGFEQDFAGLNARIQGVVDLLETVQPGDESAAANRTYSVWPSGQEGTGPEFKFSSAENALTQFLLPNLFFHITTAYDICRKQGVTLGKRDFMGAGGIAFS